MKESIENIQIRLFFNKNLKKNTIIRESDLIYLRSKKKELD